MAIEVHIQTVTGRCEDKEEPSTAYRLNFSETFTDRELSQFYIYLKHVVREVESIIDENIKDGDIIA